MIYEKLNIQFDIQKLQDHLKQFVLPLPITNQSPHFGGWSVTSNTGHFRDGWTTEGLQILQTKNFKDAQEYADNLKEKKILTSFDHVNPTEICHGYFADIISQLKQMDLNPRRVRIIRLHFQSSSTWHRDLPNHTYGVRLHIPIETNSGCFFECEEGMAHLPADGSAYLLKVNRMHRVVNDGSVHRFHLVMDVTDKTGVSRHHQYSSSSTL